MSSDRSWISSTNRLSIEYKQGVEDFVRVANNHLDYRGLSRCPCKKCGNAKRETPDTIRRHLGLNGIQQTYTVWHYHGESLPSLPLPEIIPNDTEDDMEACLADIFAEGNTYEESSSSTPCTRTFNDLLSDDSNNQDKTSLLFKEMSSELYPGCKNYSALTFLVKLMHLKVINKCTNHFFDGLLELLVDAMPEGTILPKSHYEAKAKLRNLGLGYENIDVCKNDCALFWKENVALDSCPICSTSRWKDKGEKGKKIAHKVMRYFPLTPRLMRMYSSRHIAEDMMWHHSKRLKEDGVMRHPADSMTWKHFDELYPSFAAEPRNVRLGLATDGFNPFGNQSNAYSMWPVILVPYNLPPWKCMKPENLMLSLLIPGPSSPGKDIDVFMRPLIDEFKHLWHNGVETRDAHTNSLFTMRASVLWTINDYPAYAMMSGWSTKGYKACPTCNEETPSVGIRSKIAYIGHRRFLDMDHEWRNKGSLFYGKKEHRPPPKEYSGDDILKQLEHLQYQLPGKHKEFGGVKRKRTPIELNWSKKSIFFELEYWKDLSLRHNMDVMHIEKNVCDSVLGTLLNIEGKSKDTDKARLDLADMKVRKKLHLYQDGDKWKKPHAYYTLTVAERQQFCQFVKSVEFPDGFAANLSKNVNVHDGKISGLKSHDCHVLFQRLLPAAIRPLLDREVRKAITELCLFFKQLCSRTLNISDLKKMQKDIIIILCKLEMVFPPAFFDIMVHLCLHLPNEAILGGPVHFRWMYPIERSMGVYKQYVRNRARPEGSIAEAYVVNEALTFCSMYFRGIETRFNRPERNDDRHHSRRNREYSIFKFVGRPFGKRTILPLNSQLKKKAEWYILNNCTEIEGYMNEHMNELQIRGGSNLQRQQEVEFPEWFKARVNQLRQSTPSEVSDELYALANKSNSTVFSYPGIIVNGVKYVIHSRDLKLKTQNSGIMVPSINGVNYYGVLEEILELSYMMECSVFLLRCKWYDTRRTKEDTIFTSVYVKDECYKDDPFILASQAKLVYYLNDVKNGDNWKLVNIYIPRNVWDFSDGDVEETTTSTDIPILQENNSSDLQLQVELPTVENVQYDRDGVNATEVHNVDELIATTSTQFVVDDDENEDTVAEYKDDEDDVLVNSGSDTDSDSG